jgi:hypothetical protein
MNNSNKQRTKQQLQRQYTVLYYKRTTKVHKNRGVQRYDGTLRIAAPPSCLVTLTADPSTSDAAVVNDDDCDDDDDSSEEEYGGKYGRKNGKKKSKKKKKGGGNYSNNNSNNNGVVYSGVNIELAKRAFYNNHDNSNNNNEEQQRGLKKRKTMTGSSSSNGGGGVNNNIIAPIEEDEEIILSGQWECQIVSTLLEVAQQGQLEQQGRQQQGDGMKNDNNGTAANLGDEESMKALWKHYSCGNITKEDLEATLRTHQAAIDAMKSEQRKEAERYLKK